MLAIGAVLLHAVPACMSGGELNPQPLPPGDPPPDDTRGPPAGENSGGAAPLPIHRDAGAVTDADAGNDASGDP
jgi:hypothetical protein